ncbi:hypothetical protein SLOPH_714 [Spraguea lophii 42_110]|uniref:Uncharacterized protein n=1 Tax=Spraguea lophii (strain 42_110) TaxID=1358809 RepID=S7WCT7_SPRLO|nr:hypothetical protein SLOPH_714 [Spraguea lophii 42_110]
MRKFNRKLTCFKIALQNPKLFFLNDYVYEIENEYDKAKYLGISNSEIRHLQKKIKETINFVSIFIKIKALFFEREELRKIDGIKSLKKSLSKFPNIIVL